MDIRKTLAINLKYYRYLSNLSQEKFAEALNTSLIYENQLEKCKRNPSIEMIERLSKSISQLLNMKISASDLLTYDEKKKINAKRIDGRII